MSEAKRLKALEDKNAKRVHFPEGKAPHPAQVGLQNACVTNLVFT